MSKTAINLYSATPASNTDVDGINIDEGMAPSNVNNSIRAIMSHLKEQDDGTSAMTSPLMTSAVVSGDFTVDTNTLFVDSTNDRVGIGTTSPTYGKLHIFDDNSDVDMDANGSGQLHIDGNGFNFGIALNAQGANIYTNSASRDLIFGTDETERMRIDSAGQVMLSGSTTAFDTTPAIAGLQLYYESDSGLGTIGTRSSGGATILTFHTNTGGGASSEAMRIDSSGRVLIGTTSALTGYQFRVHGGSGNAQINLGAATNFNSSIAFGDPANSAAGQILYGHSGDYMRFWVNNAERMRIDSSGALLISDTARVLACKQHLAFSGSAGQGIVIENTVNNSSGAAIRFIDYLGNYSGGGIYFSSSNSITYATSSDYRLKENVVSLTNATERLKQIPVYRFNFIGTPETVDGFMAHEVQEIVPESIIGEKDEMHDEEYTVSPATGDIYTPAQDATYDEEGAELTAATDEVIHSSDVEEPTELEEGQEWRQTTAAEMGTRTVPKYQLIDQAKLVPLLIATVQELEARITALEA